MNKIKVIGLGLFFSLFFVACTTSSSSSSTPPSTPSGEKQTLSASPESLSFTFGETNFKTSEVTSNKAGKGKYSASSNNKNVATATSNSVGLVRVTPISVGETTIIVKREGDTTYDSASQTIKISVNKQKQYLKVNLGAATSDRWKLSNDATATISVAAVSFGGVRGDSDDLVGSTTSYYIKSIVSSTGDRKVVTASVNPAGEIIITAESTGDATVTVSNKGDDNYSEDSVEIFITVNNDATQAALNFTTNGGGSTTDVTFDGYGKTASKTIAVTGGSAGDFTADSSYPVAIQFDNNNVLTITPRFVGKGVITVTRQGGIGGDGKKYNPISKDIRVTVNKPTAPTLIANPNSFTRDYNKLDDTADSMASGSSSTGDYYIESSKKGQGGSRIIAATASITSSGAITVTFEDAGTTDIIITRAGNYGYRSSSAAIIDVTVDKAAQTLSAIPSRVDVEVEGGVVYPFFSDNELRTHYTSLKRTMVFLVEGQGDGPFNENPEITNNTDNNPNNNGVVTVAVINRETDPRRDNLLSDLLKLTLDQAGTTDIIVEKQGDHNYLAGELTIRVDIAKAPHMISIEGGETDFQQQLGSIPVTVAILGAKGDGDYTIDSNDDPAVASADFENNDLTLTFGVVGDAEIVFSRNGDRNYVNSNQVTIDVEVTTQANQVLTLGVTELTVTYQDTISADVSIGTDATGTGNAIVASSSNESVATVTMIDATSIEITFDNVGSAKISVYREGNANFNRSRNRSIEVTVEQASQEITVATTDVTLSYGETFETLLSGGSAGYKIESNEGGVVTAEIDSVNSMLSIDTRDGKSGTAEIKVFAIENGNYAQSNTLTITVTVNKAAQELTASRSTFNLVYNDTTTSAIATISTITNEKTNRLDDDGKYVLSSNESIVTTDINQESGLLSLRAVGVGDATITIYKQQDSRYLKSDPIEIGVAVIKADQELTSDITSFSFDKPGDAITFVISGGLSIGEVYTATSDHANIVTTDIDIAGNLSITALATGDATVTIQRAGDANYNAAVDLTIRVRVKTQQTLLAEGAVSSFQYKYKESQNVVTIAGGQGTGGYQARYTTTGIVDSTVDKANEALSIITVSTGDTTISIYKAGDKRYNQSNTIFFPLNVARGVVELEYQTDATTIDYHPTVERRINFVASTLKIEPTTVFTYTATTSDDNVITRGHKIGVRLNPDDNDVVVSTLNADLAPATIRVTRKQTPYYEEATVDISVTVNKATLAIVPDNVPDDLTYTPYTSDFTGANSELIDLGYPTGSVVSTTFNYEADALASNSNSDTDIIDVDTNANIITVRAENASPIPVGSTIPTPARIRVTRTDPGLNYNEATIDIFVTVDKATRDLAYYNPHRNVTYSSSPTAFTIDRKDTYDAAGGSFTYTYVVLDNGASIISEPPMLTSNGFITVTPQNANDASVIIRVTRTSARNYNTATTDITVKVKRADLDLDYDDTNQVITYSPRTNPNDPNDHTGLATATITLEDPMNVGSTVFSYIYDVRDNGDSAALTILDPVSVNNSIITVMAQNAHNDPARIRVTRTDPDSNYNEATIDIFVRVNRAIQPLTYTYVSQTFTYTDIPSNVMIANPAIEDVFTGTPLIPLTYTITAIDNDDSHTYTNPDNVNNPAVATGYKVLNNPSFEGGGELSKHTLDRGTLTVTFQNAGDATVTVTRAATRNYKAASTDIGVTVEKAILLNIDYKYSATDKPIPSSGEVTVDYDIDTSIEPVDENIVDKLIEFNVFNPLNSGLHFIFNGDRRKDGKINDMRSLTLTLSPVVLTLSWGGRNYVNGSRTFTVTTLRNPTLAYEPTPVELIFEGVSMDVRQTEVSRMHGDILSTDRSNFSYSVSGFDANIISAEVLVVDDFGTIRITPKGVGTTTLEVTKTFSGSTNYYIPATTDITVNVSGVELAHVATTDAVLGDYSGLTVVKDASLFIAGQPISGRNVSNTGMFGSTIGGTTASADSITSAQIGDKTYIFTANRDTSTVTVYSYSTATGSLSEGASVEDDDNPLYEIGGASALTTATIMNRLYLFVAGSNDDGFSTFEVTNNGALTPGNNFTDSTTDLRYTFEGASALTTATKGDKHFLFVAGKDEDAVGVYEFNQAVGSSITLAKPSNNYIRDITDALSLATVSTDTKFFLYAAGSTGVREVEVSSDGGFKNQGTQILNSNNMNTFVTVAQKGDTNFLFAAYGNTLNTYVLEDNGGTSLISSSNLPTTNTDNGNSKFGGASSLTTTTIGDKLFLFVAGSTDDGVSVFEVRYLP